MFKRASQRFTCALSGWGELLNPLRLKKRYLLDTGIKSYYLVPSWLFIFVFKIPPTGCKPQPVGYLSPGRDRHVIILLLEISCRDFGLSDLPKVTQSVAEPGTKPGCQDFLVFQHLV